MKFGEELVHDHLITKDQLDKALSYQKKKPYIKLGEALLELGLIDAEKFMLVLEKQVKAGLQK